jgi:hypothetical protein
MHRGGARRRADLGSATGQPRCRQDLPGVQIDVELLYLLGATRSVPDSGVRS